ncbi:MAG: hypothetical protein ACLPZF_27510 [Candidatus Acidiferrales bacterium]
MWQVEGRSRTQFDEMVRLDLKYARARIFRSSQRDQARAYLRSKRTISSNWVRLRPSTCHNPVIPGLISNTRRRCQGL